jgi:hypothetical protein
LSKGQRKELIPTRKAFHFVIAAVAIDAAVKLAPR